MEVAENEIAKHDEIAKQECAICFDIIKVTKTREIMCGHQFHASCLSTWLKMNNSCPLCRRCIVYKGVQYDFLIYRIRSLVTECVSDLDPDVRQPKQQKLYTMIKHHNLCDDDTIIAIMHQHGIEMP